MRLAPRTAGIGLVLVICTAAAPGAFAQTPGTDIDRCPGVEGTVSGCPDSDGDGFADLDDKCPTVGDRHSPDYFLDGCPDAVFDVRYLLQTRERCTPTGCVRTRRLTRLKVVYIAGFSQLPVVSQVRCQLKSGQSCGRSHVYPPGTRFVISVRSPTRPEAGIIECHRVSITHGVSLRSFRGQAAERLGANCRGLLR
jgi:hypothetical protein